MSKPAEKLPAGRPVALYLRRSTSLQDQSIASQRDYLTRYASENGLAIVREYTDDAVSGTSVNGRDAFQRLIADAQGRPDFAAVLCYDVKRFSRGDLDEVGHFRFVLRQKGIEVIYAAEGFTDDFTGELLRPIRQVMARQESVDLSKVTLRGHLTSINSGAYIGGVPPFGYDYLYHDSSGKPCMRTRYRRNGDREMLKPDGELIRLIPQGERWRANRQDRIRLVPSLPERVEIIQRIFRMYVEQRLGYKPIASRLNAEGVPSPRCGAWSGCIYDGKWGASSIHNIIVNQTYCGDTLWNRRTSAKFHRVSGGKAVGREKKLSGTNRANPEEDWIVLRDTHEPLISRRLFAEAVRIRREKETSKNCRSLLLGRGRTSRYLLSGLVHCTLCGNGFQGYSQKKRRPTKPPEERPQTYLCGGYINKGNAVCQRRAIEKEPLESFIIDRVHDRLLQVLEEGGRELLRDYVRDELERLTGQPKDEMKKVKAELSDLKKEADRLLRNLTEDNREFIDERLVEIKRRRRELDSRLEGLQGAARQEIDTDAAVEAAMAHLGRFREVLEQGRSWSGRSSSAPSSSGSIWTPRRRRAPSTCTTWWRHLF